jgi:hypothetical protein
MSKAAQLRQKLVASNNRLPFAEALDIMGSHNNMFYMIKTGEITIEGEGDDREVVLDPGYKARRSLPIKRKAGKRAKKSAHKKSGRKAPRSGKTLKAIAQKYTASLDTTDLRAAVMGNLLASVDNLTATLRREVDGVETNPTLVAAIEGTERAAAIVKAA